MGKCFALRTRFLSDVKIGIPLPTPTAQIRRSVCEPWTPHLRQVLYKLAALS